MTALANLPIKKKKKRVMLRVIKGGLVPADPWAASQLREKGFKVGDILGADLSKLRNPKFNRLVHRIGQLCVANIDEFKYSDAHDVLKRLQLEANIACEEIAIRLPGYGMAFHRIPKSLSFDSMDEGEYHETARAFCRYIAAKYWPGMDPEAIEEMADSFVDET
jgi:hypothetical protein